MTNTLHRRADLGRSLDASGIEQALSVAPTISTLSSLSSLGSPPELHVARGARSITISESSTSDTGFGPPLHRKIFHSSRPPLNRAQQRQHPLYFLRHPQRNAKLA